MYNYNSNKKFTNFLYSYTKKVRENTKAIKGYFYYVRVLIRRAKASS